jgi:uncharacterized membrane protein (DUF2068 family)
MSAPAASTRLPWTHLKSAHKKHRKHDKILWLIGAGKIFYGLLLLAVGIGAFNLIGKNLSAELWHLIQGWNVNFHNRYIQMVFRKISAVDGQKLYFLTVVTFAYAAIFFVEGIGLILNKYWAKWLVVVVTGSFIPTELYHLVRQFGWLDFALVIFNAASVAYLIWRIKTHEHPDKSTVSKSRRKK